MTVIKDHSQAPAVDPDAQAPPDINAARRSRKRRLPGTHTERTTERDVGRMEIDDDTAAATATQQRQGTVSIATSALRHCVSDARSHDAAKHGYKVERTEQEPPPPSKKRVRFTGANKKRHVMPLPFDALSGDTNQYGYFDPQSNTTIVVVFRDASEKEGEITSYHQFSLASAYTFYHHSRYEHGLGTRYNSWVTGEPAARKIGEDSGRMIADDAMVHDGDGLRCWHCVGRIEDAMSVVSCPTRYVSLRKTFHMIGYFCGVSCAAAWGTRNGDVHTKRNCVAYLRMILKEAIRDIKGRAYSPKLDGPLEIRPALPKETLLEFGGCLTREQFRADYLGHNKNTNYVCNLDNPKFVPVSFGVFTEDRTSHPMNLTATEIRMRRSLHDSYASKSQAMASSVLRPNEIVVSSTATQAARPSKPTTQSDQPGSATQPDSTAQSPQLTTRDVSTTGEADDTATSTGLVNQSGERLALSIRTPPAKEEFTDSALSTPTHAPAPVQSPATGTTSPEIPLTSESEPNTTATNIQSYTLRRVLGASAVFFNAQSAAARPVQPTQTGQSSHHTATQPTR